MSNGSRIDKTDAKIVAVLSENHRCTLTDLSKKTGISRPTITTHLNELIGSGLLNYSSGFSLRNIDFPSALVGIEVKGESNRFIAEKSLSRCPRVLNLFRTSGKANIHVLVWGEDEHTLTSNIECFRNLPNIEIISTLFLGHPIHGDFTVKIPTEKHIESPCGKLICNDCQTYKNGNCAGCPATADYRGPLKF